MSLFLFHMNFFLKSVTGHSIYFVCIYSQVQIVYVFDFGSIRYTGSISVSQSFSTSVLMWGSKIEDRGLSEWM